MSLSQRKIKITKVLLIIAMFSILIAPLLSFAQTSTQTTDSPLVPCDNTGTTTIDPTTGQSTTTYASGHQVCDWNALLKLINNVINFILFKMLVPIAAIMFCYCGFLLLTAGGESGKKTTAKKIFSNVIWGMIIAIAAWLIVETLLTLLGYQGAWIGF